MIIGELGYHFVLALHTEHFRVNREYPNDAENQAYKDGMYFAERKFIELYEASKTEVTANDAS